MEPGSISKVEAELQKLRRSNDNDQRCWNSALTQYSKLNPMNNKFPNLLSIFDEMSKKGINRNQSSFIIALDACIHLKSFKKAIQIHQDIINNNLDQNAMIQTKLLQMYEKLWINTENNPGFLHLLLQTSTHRKSEKFRPFSPEFLSLFHKAMENQVPREQIYIYALTECGDKKLLDETKQIHQMIMSLNIISIKLWNILIRTYSQCGDHKNAWNIYKNNIPTNERDLYSYLYTLILCGYCRSLEKGKKVHNDIMMDRNKNNILNNIKIQSTLINMYGKCNDIENAEIIWNNMDKSNKNLFVYGSMMNAYTNNVKHKKYNLSALRLYDEISIYLKADNTMHLLAFKACGNIKDFEKGKRIYQDLRSRNMMKQNEKLHAGFIVFCHKCDHKMEYTDCLSIESYREAINIVNKSKNSDFNAAKSDHLIQRIINEFKLIFSHEFTLKEWLMIIDTYGLWDNTKEMMNEYKRMIDAGFKINTRIVICVLQHLIKNGEPQYVTDIWKDICIEDGMEYT